MTRPEFALHSLMVIFTMAGCHKDYDAKLRSIYRNTVPLISADSLARAMEKPGLHLLDIRSREEFEVSHIEGAHCIDYEQFKSRDVAYIPKDAQVVLYCSVGYRSERIGERMQEMGYEDVKNLYGGIFQWKNEGKIVVNPKNHPTDSVHAYNRVWSVWLRKGVKVY
jgi:rhodanese-related sulfurtransferase